jgi:hypothetical protein
VLFQIDELRLKKVKKRSSIIEGSKYSSKPSIQVSGTEVFRYKLKHAR